MKKSTLNPMRKWVVLTSIISILSFLVIVTGVLAINEIIGLNKTFGQKSGGYILAMGIMALMFSLAVFGIAKSSAKRIDELLDGTDRLAHWRYTSDEWTQFISTETVFETKNKSKRVLKLVLILGGVTLFTLIYANKNFLSYLPFLIMTAGIYTVFWYLEDWNDGSVGANKGNPQPEAYFNEDGVFINNHYTEFGFGKSFQIIKKQNELSVIEFQWRTKTKMGSVTDHQMRLPIPQNEEEKTSDLLVTYGFKV